jgi:hypothetical protein
MKGFLGGQACSVLKFSPRICCSLSVALSLSLSLSLYLSIYFSVCLCSIVAGGGRGLLLGIKVVDLLPRHLLGLVVWPCVPREKPCDGGTMRHRSPAPRLQRQKAETQRDKQAALPASSIKAHGFDGAHGFGTLQGGIRGWGRGLTCHTPSRQALERQHPVSHDAHRALKFASPPLYVLSSQFSVLQFSVRSAWFGSLDSYNPRLSSKTGQRDDESCCLVGVCGMCRLCRLPFWADGRFCSQPLAS